MRKLITGSLMLCSILSLRAQTFVKPAVKVKDTSFAVITDKGTFQACEAELKAYQEILGKEGLPTFIVYNEWNKPEDVKKVIVKLYKRINWKEWYLSVISLFQCSAKPSI